ncbi:Nicotinate-nucleotide adenylyltransferase [Minicystis rosea]|nr:Nicotinate-nucleotide adenylyltransferase [Minicystis rosea]
MERSASIDPTNAACPRRVAVYGGSFNPPHVGHVLGVVYALSTAPIDEVLVVPVYRHPFAKNLASYPDRLALCRLALGWLPHVTISTVEEELGGESLTLRTVEHLIATHPSWSLRLLVGSDVLADLPKWHRWDRIAALAPPLVMGRAGVDATEAAVTWVGKPEDAMLPRVSSSEIRAAIASGRIDDVRALVPASVLDHITTRGLYQG